MEEAAPSSRRPECLCWAFFVPLAQDCSWWGAQFRVTALSHVLLCARLAEGAGYCVREPVASSPQPEPMKRHQLHFRDGKLRLSQGQGLDWDTSRERADLCPNVCPPYTTRGRQGSADGAWLALITIPGAPPHIHIHPERRLGNKQCGLEGSALWGEDHGLGGEEEERGPGGGDWRSPGGFSHRDSQFPSSALGSNFSPFIRDGCLSLSLYPSLSCVLCVCVSL